MLIIYPLYNVFRAVGLYLPKPEIAAEELAGAAAFEILRYLVVLSLIVWVGFSKSLRSHLATEAAHSASKPLVPTRNGEAPLLGAQRRR
jgi:hypothetical protein